MFEDAIKKIREILVPKGRESISPVLGKEYSAAEFSEKNFHDISQDSTSKRIAFIDGGSAEIVSSESFALGIIRAACVVFEEKKRVFQEICEFLVLARCRIDREDIEFMVSFQKLKGSIEMEDISFGNDDETLKVGANSAELKSVLGASRRFLELKLASKTAKSRKAKIIMLDGNLKQSYTHEQELLNELYSSCEASGIVLCALSKTSSVICRDGASFAQRLLLSSSRGLWIYYPVAKNAPKNHDAFISFAKFHPKATMAFKMEIYSKQKEKIGEACSEISKYCNDPIFLGYPYGLIEADRMARVSNAEKESLRHNIAARLGKDSVLIENSNPHSILDRISF